MIPLVGMRILFEDNALFLLTVSRSKLFYVVFSITLILPTLIDGIRQYGFNKESPNRRRIVTGFIAGFGLFLLKILIMRPL